MKGKLSGVVGSVFAGVPRRSQARAKELVALEPDVILGTVRGHNPLQADAGGVRPLFHVGVGPRSPTRQLCIICK
jgi:hypothetical protein